MIINKITEKQIKIGLQNFVSKNFNNSIQFYQWLFKTTGGDELKTVLEFYPEIEEQSRESNKQQAKNFKKKAKQISCKPALLSSIYNMLSKDSPVMQYRHIYQKLSLGRKNDLYIYNYIEKEIAPLTKERLSKIESNYKQRKKFNLL